MPRAGGLTESLHHFLYPRAGLGRGGAGVLPLGHTGWPCLRPTPPLHPSSSGPSLRASGRERADGG